MRSTQFMPSELICNEAFYMSGMDLDDLKDRLGIAIYSLDSWYFDDEGCQPGPAGAFPGEQYGCPWRGRLRLRRDRGGSPAYLSAGDPEDSSLSHMSQLSVYTTGKYMVLDSSTRRNLELCETLREKQKKGSLLWVLDKTRTAMGARLLRKYIEQPLIDRAQIEKRLDAVEELKENAISREELREYLIPGL